MAKSKNQKLNIICLSNQLWDFPNWTNKRHVMHRLSKQGHNVIFVDPPINTGSVFFRQIQRGYWNIKRLITQQKTTDEGTLVYTPLNVLPLSEFNSQIHSKRINKLSKKNLNPKNKTILWIYHVQIPHIQNYINNIEYDLLVYDCVDNYTAFPEQSKFYSASANKKITAQQEQILSEQADIIFGSTPGLVEKLEKFNKNVHFTPNVGDYNKFKDASSFSQDLPDDIKSIPRPRIGFTGALDDYKFDMTLMKKVAKENPRYSFVLIGPMAIKDRNATLDELGLEEYKNIYLLGSRPYKEIHKYFAGFDSYIIPYQLNEYTVIGCFPVKFHDALAAGLPVVTTDMPAYYPFRDVCYIAKDYTSFSTLIKNSLEEDNDQKKKERQFVASQNTWDNKVSNMLEIIYSQLKL